jgi:hypothetical protein
MARHRPLRLRRGADGRDPHRCVVVVASRCPRGGGYEVRRRQAGADQPALAGPAP